MASFALGVRQILEESKFMVSMKGGMHWFAVVPIFDYLELVSVCPNFLENSRRERLELQSVDLQAAECSRDC